MDTLQPHTAPVWRVEQSHYLLEPGGKGDCDHIYRVVRTSTGEVVLTLRSFTQPYGERERGSGVQSLRISEDNRAVIIFTWEGEEQRLELPGPGVMT